MEREQRVKVEFHLHTAETSPCGQVPAHELMHAMAKAGYGGIIVTDHYLPHRFEPIDRRAQFLEGYRIAKAAGQALGLTVLPGMEFRFDRGDEDYLIYGMAEDDFTALPDNLCSYSHKDFYAYCQSHGFLVYQAHPFRPGMTAQDPAYLDGIEVQNGNPRHNSRNPLALAYARRYGLLEVTGGDVHQMEDVRTNALRVPLAQLTPKGIVEFLQTNPNVGPEFAET